MQIKSSFLHNFFLEVLCHLRIYFWSHVKFYISLSVNAILIPSLALVYFVQCVHVIAGFTTILGSRRLSRQFFVIGGFPWPKLFFEMEGIFMEARRNFI
jgi:hypothetical protein